jgi:hypothetical protein
LYFLQFVKGNEQKIYSHEEFSFVWVKKYDSKVVITQYLIGGRFFKFPATVAGKL